MAKYSMGEYQECPFHGGSNILLKLVTCKDKVIFPLILQNFVLNWYHTYIIHPVTDRTESMIRQHL